jgi:hypothetical protein
MGIILILIFVVIILILLVFAGFWTSLALVVIGAGVFALVMYLLRRFFGDVI